MRIAAVLLFVLVGCVSTQAASSCSKDCRDFLRACLKAHSQSACKVDYEICMKHCKER